MTSPSHRVRALGGFVFSSCALVAACSSNSLLDDQRDKDGDGVVDSLGSTIDANGDGQPDQIDIDGDGVLDGIGVDTNGDGVLDALAIDTNGDGLFDALDTNGDKIADVFSEGGGTGGASSSGGAPSSGGDVGTGGNETSTGGTTPQGPRPLPDGWSGFLSYKVADSTIDSIYEEWKTNHVESCGDGTSRVKRGPEDNGDTVSEGIAYGMLLAVGHDDQTLFDELWAYFQKYSVGGLMQWKLSGCSGVVDSNNATDAELDAAMALIQASCKWSSETYKTDAASLLGAVISQLSATKGGNSTLLPGKTGFTGDCLNPSYVAPGYYRAFANVDTANQAAWNDLAADAYPLLNAVANATTGLVPDWSGCEGGKSANYTYDAARTPWRVATDYLWYGTPEAKTFSDRVTNWVAALPEGIGSVRDGYTLTGTQTGQYVNAAFTGAFATAAFAHSQERADAFGQVLNNVRGSNYFGRSLKAIYVLLASGRFDKSCY